MSRRSILELRGFIRLVQDVDCIGIAVFGGNGMNHDWVAETDGDLNITRFAELYPEQGYQIDKIPSGIDFKKKFSIGDPGPIPFVYDGRVALVMGDRYPDDVAIPAASASAAVVKKEIRLLLCKARNGDFWQQLDYWENQAVEALFSDVFSERPSNTRYWISRFRLSVKQCAVKNRPKKVTADLRKIGMRWLALFGAKTDMSKIKQMFSNLEDGVFGRDDYISVIFGFLCNKFVNCEFSFLEKFAKSDPTFLGLFPDGLYFFDLTHAGIRVPFIFQRPKDFLEEFKIRLYNAERDWKFSRVKDLALVLFGIKDIPSELIEPLSTIRVDLAKEYRDSKREIDRRRDMYRPIAQVVELETDLAHRTVRLYDALTNLEAIEYGNVRLSPRPDDFLVKDRGFIEDLRQAL